MQKMLLTLSSGNKKLGPWSVNTVLLGGSKQTENAVNATNAIEWKQESRTEVSVGAPINSSFHRTEFADKGCWYEVPVRTTSV